MQHQTRDGEPHERHGLLFAALCALNGAFVPAVAKLTTGRADSLFVATVTTMFAALCAACVLGWRGDLPALVRHGHGPRLALVGALGTAAAYVLFYAGARRSTAIDAVLCLQVEPAYSLLAAWVFLGHRPTPRRVCATLMLLAGIVVAVGAQGFSGSSGIWLLLATPLCWQASHLVVLRALRGVTPFVLTGARFIFGGGLLLLYWAAGAGLASVPPPGALLAQLPLLALQGLVLTYVGTFLWYQAVTRLDLARTTAIVVPSIPLLSFGASFVLLGEVPAAHQWVGLLLIASGVFIFVTAPHAAPPIAKAPAMVAEEML
jgi:probable blue pigment (indigoidine) exporter